MSQKDSDAAASKLEPTRREALDVELGLELDSCRSNTDNDDDPNSLYHHHQSPLHVRGIKRMDGRPVSAEVNYDQTSRKLLIYTFSAGGGDDVESSAKTGRRVLESDLYLRRQSTPEAFGGNKSRVVGGGRKAKDLSTEPSELSELELAERELVWEKRKSYDAGCGGDRVDGVGVGVTVGGGVGGGGGAREDDAGGRAVYSNLTWSDIMDEGYKATGERSSSSLSQRQKVGETFTTRFVEMERRDTERATKQTANPVRGDQFYDNDEGRCTDGNKGLLSNLNRGDIVEGSRWNGGNLQETLAFRETGSSLPSVVFANDLQSKTQKDMHRILPSQAEWMIPDGVYREPSTHHRMLDHETKPQIYTKSTENSKAELRWKPSPSFPHDANIRRRFWKENPKSPTTTEEVSKSEGALEGTMTRRSEGSLRGQWRGDSTHHAADDDNAKDQSTSVDIGVPLRIEIPEEHVTRRQPTKERSQRNNEILRSSATAYLNLRKPEVIREGLALQTNFTETGISRRNFNVHSNDRFSYRTGESGNTETSSSTDRTDDGGGSQFNNSLLLARRKPLEFQNSHQRRYGSLRDADAAGSLQRIAISLEDKLNAEQRDIANNSDTPTLPQANQERLEETALSKPRTNETSKMNEQNAKHRVPSLTIVNLSGSKPFSAAQSNLTGLSYAGEERGHVESTLPVRRSSEDGLEISNSMHHQLFQDKRFQSESNIQDCTKIDVLQSELPSVYHPLQDRSCSVPIIQNHPPQDNFFQEDFFDSQHRPGSQKSFTLSSCNQPSKKSWTSDSSMMPPADDLQTTRNTLASNQTILEYSSSKDLKSSDSGRSFVQSAEYIASKSPRMMVFSPQCSLGKVMVPTEGGRPRHDEKSHRKSLPLVFYNSRYKETEETVDPLEFNSGKESDTWMQSSGTGDSSWRSFPGIQVEREDEHVPDERRQAASLDHSTEKKPPKPKLEMTRQSQPGDWHYNTIYEPDTPSPSNEIPPTTKDSTEQENHGASGMAGQPDSHWNSLPSLLDTSGDLHRDKEEGVSFQKSISSDRIHSRIWVPTNRGHRSKQTSTTGNHPTDENLSHLQTTTTETPGASAWVDLTEDSDNGHDSGKCKTVYSREIKQVPSVASHMFRNTKRQFVSLGGKTQRDSATHATTKTEVKEAIGKNVAKAGTNDFTQGTKCSDASLCSVDNTKIEREWKSAEVLARKEQSQQNRAPKINQLRHSTSDNIEDGESKPRSVHRPIIQIEGKNNSAHLEKTKRIQTETVGSSRPAVPSPPFSQTNETSGAIIKLGSAEIPTSNSPNDTVVQQTIGFRSGDTKPNKDSSRSNHLPQIDITTIKARVFRLTDDNVTTEFSTASNQLDKSKGLRDKLSTKVHVKDQHTLNLDKDGLHGHETTAQEGKGDVKSFIQSKISSSSADQTSDQTTKRLEDLGMDETFKDFDYELSRLMKIDEPKPESKNSKSKRSVVQPLSSANLSLLEPSRTNEWRNTSLEYAKQWLDSTAQCNKSLVNIDNHLFCDKKFGNADMESTGDVPQEEMYAENGSCGFDGKVIDSILQDIVIGENERSYSDGNGMRELSKTCDLTTCNIRSPSKARSRDLLTEHALGIPVAAARPTQLQVYLIGDEKSLAFSNRISRSRRQTDGTELDDGQQSCPQKQHTQNHGSVLKSRDGSARELLTPDGNTHRSNLSLGSSTMTKCEVEDHNSSSSGKSVKEHRPMPHAGLSSGTHQLHIRQEDDVSAAKLRGYHHVQEDFSGRLTIDESRKTGIYLAPLGATVEAEREDRKRSEKPRDSDAKNSHHQQRKILPSDPTRSDNVSVDSSSDPADSKLFHEMTLEWSPAKGNLLAASKTPEQCFVCSRTARLPDIPSLQYYKLSHRCLRSSLQHVDSSTTKHSMFLINSRSEMSLREMGNISRNVSERHCSSVPVHGSSVPVHGSSVPVYGSSDPVHGSSDPVHGTSVPVHSSSVPVHNSSVPVQRNSRRSLSAVDAPSVRGRHPISGGSTNVSDPCLSTTTASVQFVSPIGHSSAGIRHHPPRKDEQGLLTPHFKVFREHKTTNETHVNIPWTEPRIRYPIPNHQSSGQSLTQSSVGDTQVRLGQAPLKSSLHPDRLTFNADDRADTNRALCNFASQARDIPIDQSLRIYLTHLHDPYSEEANCQDRSDTELTDNTDVSLDGLMLRPDEAAGNSPSIDPFEYSDMEAIFPTTDISTFVFENFQRDQDLNRARDDTGQGNYHFSSGEIGTRGMNQHHGSHYGVSELQELCHYDKHKKPGSFANAVTRKSEISRQNDVSMFPLRQPGEAFPDKSQGQPVQGTGFTTRETRLEVVDLLRDSETAGNRTTSGVLWRSEANDNIATAEDDSERDPKEMVASFNDLVSPFMKPTKDGKNSTEANSQSHSIAQLKAQQPTGVFPSSSALPSGRVKYRKLSPHISNLVPSYNASPCASNNNSNRNAHSNQDSV